MNKCLMFLLAILPILNIYCLPFGPDIPLGNLIILGFLCVSLIKNDRFYRIKLPRGFVLLWVYLAISYFINTANHFSIANFVPGGFAFFSWALIFWFLSAHFDFNNYRKYYRYVFLVAGIVFLFQEFTYNFMGFRIPFLFDLPISGGNKYAELYDMQVSIDRSSSFFREPSHFAQFSLVLLAIELFSSLRSQKIISSFSVFIIFILVLIRSGNGMVGLIVIFVFWLMTVMRKAKLKTKFAVLFIIIPIAIYSTTRIIGTESGVEMMERASNLGMNEDSESFDRTFRGYFLYDIMPIRNKVFGISQEDLLPFIGRSSLALLFTMNGQNDTYLNGIQHVLILSGMIGLILFLLVFLWLYKHNTPFAKCLVILFLVLMLFGNLYCSHLMLTVMLIAETERKRMLCHLSMLENNSERVTTEILKRITL